MSPLIVEEGALSVGSPSDKTTLRTTVSIAFGGACTTLVAAPGASKKLMLYWVDWVPNSTDKTFFRVGFSSTACVVGCAGSNAAAANANNLKIVGILGAANTAITVSNVDAALALAADIVIQYATIDIPA